MRILMVNCEYPPIGGGAAQANHQLLKQFAHQPDLYVDLLTSGIKSCPPIETFASNINIHRIPLKKKNLHYWRKLEVIRWIYQANRYYRQLITQNHYDLAHAFFAFPSGYPCYRSADHLPYIVSLRGSDVPGYNVRLGLDYLLLARLFRNIWNRADSVIANSIGLRDLAQKFTPNLEIPVIPNGIDTEQYIPAPQHPFHRPIRALTVARLISRKRLDLLISTLAHTNQLNTPVHLTIAGQGNLLQTLRKQADTLNVLEQITFLGRVPSEQMPAVYQQHDLFLMSSAHEGMSNAMLEAMASGLPIITTPCEGVTELITNNGIIVNQPNPQAIAQAIVNLSTNEDLYRTMSQNARQHAASFSWQATAQQYLDIYRQIIKQRKTTVQ